MMEKKSSNQSQRESKSSKAGLMFPVSRFQRNLRKGNYANRIGTAGAVYLTGVLEYLTAEIVEIAGNACREHNRLRIVPRHIMLAIKNDAEINELLRDAFFSGSGVMPNINPLLIKSKSTKGKMSESAVTDGGKTAGEPDGDESVDDHDDHGDESDEESDEEDEEEGEYDEAVTGSQNF